MTFEQLYTRYYPDVFRFSSWLAGDTTEAEDIASETFIRAWGRRDRIRTETLKGYLFTIARNIFINQYRRSTRNEQLPGNLTDSSPDPQRAAEARMDLERVSRALAKLPDVDRLALVLKTEHALPYDEVARVLEISVGAARVRVHRARRRLLQTALNTRGGER